MAGRAGLPRVDIRKIIAGGAIAIAVGAVAAAAPVSLTFSPADVVIDTPPGGISLVSFDSCETALGSFRRAAIPYVGPYGFGGPTFMADSSGGIALEAAPAPGAPGAAAGAPAPQQDSRKSAGEQSNSAAGQGAAQAPNHSGTNNHEAGVDEPDIVKTDGKRLVSIADGQLKVVDVASRKLTGTLEVPNLYVSHMLISGDRALLVTDQQSAVIYDMPTPRGTPTPGKPAPSVPPGMGSKLVLVDLVGTPKILGTLEVDGGYVDARQVGSVARVVVRSQPKLKFVYPDGTRTPASSMSENREIASTASIDDWLPRYVLEREGAKSEGRLVDCNRVSHPTYYTGTGMLTVLTLDLTRDLGTGDPVAVAADGDTVYGSGTSLYIADDHRSRMVPQRFDTRTLPIPPMPDKTQIHRFDIAGAGPPKYAGSGEVEGALLNQYSLSEYNGHLRVATTVGQPGAPNAPQQSQSMVTVLARGDNSLTQVGRVDGLGKGERIYAVRFFGSVGYVVTFRQVDPLYTLDLSQPAKPRVVGELKITGYSAYLHPVGEGKVLGVGQEATDQGRRLGSQVSLFDVANPATPNRLAQHQIEGGSSEVEYDAHAFLYWPARNLVVVPVMETKIARSLNGQYNQSNYALVLRIEQGRLVEAGRVSHTNGMIRRSLVIGDDLWTLSDAGFMVSGLDGLGQKAWIALR
jgi:uncharacterized secreted protein with C-terminal beta-propeller domain